MIRTYADLCEDALTGIPFDDPLRALELLRDFAGHNVPDETFDRLLEKLIPALERAADPTRSLVNFAAWVDRAGSRSLYYDLFITHPTALSSLLTIVGTSQFLANLLLATPEYLEVLTNPAIRDRERTVADFLADARRRIAPAASVAMQRDALRRFKPPEILRIGARDLLGYADALQTVREISDFAEACIRMAIEIAQAPPGLAVIAMGKLGGRELNYASDIDLIFVHDDDMPQAVALKLAEHIRDTLALVTPAGFLFRVDLRLRPEGRFGPISRTLSACRAYYEVWAESWERQALLKARWVGGDEAVAQQFLQIAERFVFSRHVQSSFLDEIRQNKQSIERQTARNDEAMSNVKQGVGGIRDVEFAVQMLQLIAGGAHPELRTPNTIEALARLETNGLISAQERATLGESYLFLRDVEHRLQIMDERPVRTLPLDNPAEMTKFARRLGYANTDAFLEEYRRQTQRVNSIFVEIFYDGKNAPVESAFPGADLAEWVRTIADTGSQEALAARLTSLGFQDVGGAIEIVKRLELGTRYGEFIPAAREEFAQIAPLLLEAASATSDPDGALHGMDALAEAVPSRAALYRTLGGEAQFVGRLMQLAAEAPVIWETLLRHLEYLDLLGDEGALESEDTADLVSGPNIAHDLAAFLRRERLRIGACDLWEIIPADSVGTRLTALAQCALSVALRLPGFEDITPSLAIVGLGKLGGGELGYSSDLDVLWVLDDGGDHERAAELARAVTSLLTNGMKGDGVSWETDSRLRPDGRVGTLVRTVSEYEAYYDGGGADTWEFQALIKARAVAGNAAVGAAFEAFARRMVYSTPITDEQVASLRHMKRRVEKERCKDPRDIKLGPGGLSDIEWTAQLLQWRWGVRWPKSRQPSTRAALDALRDAGVLRQDDWETLTDAYAALNRLRKRRWLLGDRAKASSDPDAVTQLRIRVRDILRRLFFGE